ARCDFRPTGRSRGAAVASGLRSDRAGHCRPRKGGALCIQSGKDGQQMSAGNHSLVVLPELSAGPGPPLREVVAAGIRDAILAGRYGAGERLTEDRLAADFGVSRNPVREALRSLAAEGLVIVAARRGAVVAALRREEAREMIEVRATLEALNAR